MKTETRHTCVPDHLVTMVYTYWCLIIWPQLFKDVAKVNNNNKSLSLDQFQHLSYEYYDPASSFCQFFSLDQLYSISYEYYDPASSFCQFFSLDQFQHEFLILDITMSMYSLSQTNLLCNTSLITHQNKYKRCLHNNDSYKVEHQQCHRTLLIQDGQTY